MCGNYAAKAFIIILALFNLLAVYISILAQESSSDTASNCQQ